MRATNLPRTAQICGERIRLRWEPTASLDGWYAQVSPRRVRIWELDPSVSMDTIIKDLERYCDRVRYAQDNYGHTFLCAYRRA